MSSAPERPEAKSRLPEAAPAHVSESCQEAAATERQEWTSFSVRWSTVSDVASQHQFEGSESESKSASEEEGEEEEDEELEEEEPRGVFTHCELFGPQVICTSSWVCASPDWDEGGPRFLWGWRPARGGRGDGWTEVGTEGGPDTWKSSFRQKRRAVAFTLLRG